MLRRDARMLTNPFAGWEYSHAIVGSLVTASMVMAGTGAYYTLIGMHREFARISIREGVISGVIFALLQLFPTDDKNAENVTDYQPAKQAAMEGLFHTEYGAPLAIIGMPDEPHQRLIDPIEVPDLLSFSIPVRSGLLANLGAHPILWIVPAILALMVAAVVYFAFTDEDSVAFYSGIGLIATLLVAAGISIFRTSCTPRWIRDTASLSGTLPHHRWRSVPGC